MTGTDLAHTLSRFLRSGALSTNLFFSVYLLLFHDLVYTRLFHDSIRNMGRGIIHSGKSYPLLGVLLLGAIVGQTVAFFWKWRYGGMRGEAGFGRFVLWIFHAVISVLIVMMAFGALGVNVEDPPPLLVVALFAIVIRDLFILVLIISPPAEPRTSISRTLLADLFFAIIYSLAYTLVIGNIIGASNYNTCLLAYWYSPAAFVMNTILVIILFLMLYLPMRLPYFLISEEKTPLKNIASILAISLVCLGAILPLFAGEYSLDRSLRNPHGVELLFLNGRKIESLPPEIGRLDNLRALHLGYNRLTSLPPEFAKLRRLQWLNLGGNTFTEVPQEVLALPSLRDLDLHYNRIRGFPRDLAPFMKMERIRVRSNPLSPEEKERLRQALGERMVFD